MEDKKTEEKKRGENEFWIITLVISVIFFLVEYFLLSKYETEIFSEKWNWGWAVFFAQVSYTLLSIKIVGPTELGAILFLGKRIKEVRSGPVFVLWLLCQLKKETMLVIQEELPADPEHIFRGEGNVPEGMFPPIRIPFADKPEGDDPLSRRVTAEIVPIIRWRIDDYLKFLSVIGSREEAKRQMEDITIALCMRELTSLTSAEALVGLAKFNKKLKLTVDKLVENWGINVETAQIKVINFHHELNIAIGSVAEAAFTKRAIITAAEAEKRKRELEGEGDGLAEKAVLDGRTAGLKKMMDDLKVSAEIILGAETARAITNNPGQKTVIVGPKGFDDLIGVATGIGKTLLKESEKTGG